MNDGVWIGKEKLFKRSISHKPPIFHNIGVDSITSRGRGVEKISQ